MAKITPRQESDDTQTIVVKTKTNSKKDQVGAWWKSRSKQDLCNSLIATATLLKEQSSYRYRQAGMYAKLYGNMPLFGWIGMNYTKINVTNQLPIDRPTMSVVTSCIDTLTSRLIQSKPRPVFLTDNGDYKQRTLAKKLNAFIQGEFYQTKAYQIGQEILRDCAIFGTGVIKVLESMDGRVALERKLWTDLLFDPNDSLFKDPRQMYEVKLIDRQVLAETFPEYRSIIERAEQAFPDNAGQSDKTVSDLVMVVEGWHLRSSKSSNDGRHTIACSEGVIFDEEYVKDKFPFVFLEYVTRPLGPWGQGIPERLMGTQVEINKLLITISQSINLVGVPRVFVEDGSKVVKASLNNSIGAIVTYRGTKPIYEVAPCVPVELYGQLQRLIDYAYQQEGISQLAASAKKPQGLNSGVAIREYDDLQTDRFTALEKRYEQFYVDLAYLIIDKAVDIAKRDGKYETVYPNKNGTKEIDLPDVKELNDPFVIQCFDVSSLPKEPAGRLQKVVEMMQAGIISPQEGRRLLDFPDIEQVDKLATAAEERILKILDEIVEDGKYTPPDAFMDLTLAKQLVTQYYNLYIVANLSESKAQKLRDFFSQIHALESQAQQAVAAQQQQLQPQAPPQAMAPSEMVPNVPNPMPQ